jgi:hypothetical protein
MYLLYLAEAKTQTNLKRKFVVFYNKAETTEQKTLIVLSLSGRNVPGGVVDKITIERLLTLT